MRLTPLEAQNYKASNEANDRAFLFKMMKNQTHFNKKTKTNCTVLQQHNHLDGFVICGALQRLRVDGDRYCEALPSAGPANKPARAKLFSRFPCQL